MSEIQPEQLYSIKFTAEKLCVTCHTLRNWDNNEKFKSIRTIGGHRRYSGKQILESTTSKRIYSSTIEDNMIQRKNKIDFIAKDSPEFIRETRQKPRYTHPFCKNEIEGIWASVQAHPEYLTLADAMEDKPYTINRPDEWVSKWDDLGSLWRRIKQTLENRVCKGGMNGSLKGGAIVALYLKNFAEWHDKQEIKHNGIPAAPNTITVQIVKDEPK